MALTTGMQIGPYEIVGSLGAGGMGEVYRARDPRLDRSVAIKALPQGFATDPERLARFEREAKLLAALNHANVASIYGLEEVSGAPYLVLEFIDGETLANRLARGPLPLKEALDVGVQIASAIEAAHARDIVHRDLKPGNIMLTESRTVKVLDFGLAKDTNTSEPGGDLSTSPTVAIGATGAGLILGTAAYMSPEQARGKPVDRRTDVWALGCVLFECLTSRQVFSGETVSDIIARILEREPDWTTLPESVPARLHDVIARCLTKEMDARPRDVGDLQRELRGIRQDLSSGSAMSRPAPKQDIPSLAVLYFQNMANDPDSEYFCSGITEDILTDLSKIKGLRVASRSAVSRFRGEQRDVSEVARELKVGAVLEGSVRRAGDRVRINVQLINGADGFQMWAERFDRTLEDVFAVQEEIASAITEALRVTLTKDEAENIVQNRPKDVQAYDLYLRGYAEYGKYTHESLQKAIELFNEAIAIDPSYARAYAGLADSYGQLCQWGHDVDKEDLLARGLASAEKAIKLNPRLPEAYKAHALVLRFLGRLDDARAALKKALEADPNFAPALLNLAVDSFGRGDIAGCERLARRVNDTGEEAAFALTWVAFICMQTMRYGEAVEWTERIRDISQERFYTTANSLARAWIAFEGSDDAAAEKELKAGLEAGADPGNMKAVEAVLAVRRGNTEEARKRLSEMTNETELLAGSLILAAGAALKMHDVDVAVGFMTRGILADLSGTIVRLIPGLHPLLKHEAFAPRRSENALIWPLEAPMMKPSIHSLFAEVRIESGQSPGSDISPL